MWGANKGERAGCRLSTFAFAFDDLSERERQDGLLLGLRERRGVLRCGDAALRVPLLAAHLQKEHLQAARELDQEVTNERDEGPQKYKLPPPDPPAGVRPSGGPTLLPVAAPSTPFARIH